MNPPNPKDQACNADWEMLQYMLQGSRKSRHVEHAPNLASAPLPIVPENESFSDGDGTNVVEFVLVRGKKIELRYFPREERLRFLEWEEDDPKQRPPGYSLHCQTFQSRLPPQLSQPSVVLKSRAPSTNHPAAGDGNKPLPLSGQPPQSTGFKQNPFNAQPSANKNQPFSIHVRPSSLNGNNPQYYRLSHSLDESTPQPTHPSPLPDVSKPPASYGRPAVEESKPIPDHSLGETMLLHYHQPTHPNDEPLPSCSHPNATREMLYDPVNDPPPPFKLLSSDFGTGIKPANVSTRQNPQFHWEESPGQIPDPHYANYDLDSELAEIPYPRNPNFCPERNLEGLRDPHQANHKLDCELAEIPHARNPNFRSERYLEGLRDTRFVNYNSECGKAKIPDPQNLNFRSERDVVEIQDPRHLAYGPEPILAQVPYTRPLHFCPDQSDLQTWKPHSEFRHNEMPNLQNVNYNPEHSFAHITDLHSPSFRQKHGLANVPDTRNNYGGHGRGRVQNPYPRSLDYSQKHKLAEMQGVQNICPESDYKEMPNSGALDFCHKQQVNPESFQEFLQDQLPDPRNHNYRAKCISTPLSNPQNFNERVPTELPELHTVNFCPKSSLAELPNPLLSKISTNRGVVKVSEEHPEVSCEDRPIPRNLKFDPKRGVPCIPDPRNSELRTECGVAETPYLANLDNPPERGLAQIPASYDEFCRDPRWTYEYMVVPVSATPVKFAVRGRGRIAEGVKEFPQKDTLVVERRLMADFGIVTDAGPAYNEPRIFALPCQATQLPSEPEACGSIPTNAAAACDQMPAAAESRLVSDFGIVVDVGREDSHDVMGQNSRMQIAHKNATASLEEPVLKSESTAERHESQKPALKLAPNAQDFRTNAEKSESRKPEAKSAQNEQDCHTSTETKRPESQKQEAKLAPNGQDYSTKPSKLDMEKPRNERKRAGDVRIYVPPPQRNEQEKLAASRSSVSKSRVSDGGATKLSSANEKGQRDSKTVVESWDLNSDSKEKLRLGLVVEGHRDIHLKTPAKVDADSSKRRPRSRGPRGIIAGMCDGSVLGKVAASSKLNSNVPISGDGGFREPMKSTGKPKSEGPLQAPEKMSRNTGTVPKSVLRVDTCALKSNRDGPESSHVVFSESESRKMEPKCGGTSETTLEKLSNKDTEPKAVKGEETRRLESNRNVSRSKMSCRGGFSESNCGAVKPKLETTPAKCQNKGAVPNSIPRVETQGMERNEKARCSFHGNFTESTSRTTEPKIRGTPELTAEECKSGENDSAMSNPISREGTLGRKHNINAAASRVGNESPGKAEGNMPNVFLEKPPDKKKRRVRKFVRLHRSKRNLSSRQVSNKVINPLQKTEEEMSRPVASNVRGNARVFPSQRKDIPRQSVECTTGTRGSTEKEAERTIPREARKSFEPNSRTGELPRKPVRQTPKPGGEISSFVQPRNGKRAGPVSQHFCPQMKERQVADGADSEHQDKEPEASGQEPKGKEGATIADSGTQEMEGGATIQEAAKDVSAVKLFPDLDMEHQCLILPAVPQESGALFADLDELFRFGAKSPSYN